MEELDIRRLSMIARELGLEVNEPSSAEEAGLYIGCENESVKWNAIEELGLSACEQNYVQYLNKEFFKEETDSMSYYYADEIEGKMEFNTKYSKSSLLSEAA